MFNVLALSSSSQHAVGPKPVFLNQKHELNNKEAVGGSHLRRTLADNELYHLKESETVIWCGPTR